MVADFSFLQKYKCAAAMHCNVCGFFRTCYVIFFVWVGLISPYFGPPKHRSWWHRHHPSLSPPRFLILVVHWAVHWRSFGCLLSPIHIFCLFAFLSFCIFVSLSFRLSFFSGFCSFIVHLSSFEIAWKPPEFFYCLVIFLSFCITVFLSLRISVLVDHSSSNFIFVHWRTFWCHLRLV